MALIKPCADLRNNYNEISKICHETNEPVYITRNGVNDLVLLSDEAYESIANIYEETKEERIHRLIAGKFNKQYDSFEEFRKDLYEKIEQALKDVDDGRCQPFEEFCAEMEAEYHIHGQLRNYNN